MARSVAPLHSPLNEAKPLATSAATTIDAGARQRDMTTLSEAVHRNDLVVVKAVLGRLSRLDAHRTDLLIEALRHSDAQALLLVQALMAGGVSIRSRDLVSQAFQRQLWNVATFLLENDAWAPTGSDMAAAWQTTEPNHAKALIDQVRDVALQAPIPVLRVTLNNVSLSVARVAAHATCNCWIRSARPTGASNGTPTVMSERRIAVLDAFFDAGVALHAADAQTVAQRTFLHQAVVLRDADLVEHLLQRGAPIENKSFELVGEFQGQWLIDRWVYLAHLAVLHPCVEVVERLLNHGVVFDDPKEIVSDGMGTALNTARALDRQEVLIAVERHAMRQALAQAQAEQHDAGEDAPLPVRGRARL